MRALYSLLVVSALASGCVHAQAKTMPDAPPLEVPAAPPHDVESNETEPPPLVPLIAEPARTPAVRRPAPQPARPEPPKPAEPAKVEPPKTEPKTEPAPAEPAKLIDPSKPPTTLQTTPPTAEGEVERGIKASLARATSDLNRIDYRVLNADARTQYDTAKRFIRQADDAMRAKNLVFAKDLSDKAATLAAQLAGR